MCAVCTLQFSLKSMDRPQMHIQIIPLYWFVVPVMRLYIGTPMPQCTCHLSGHLYHPFSNLLLYWIFADTIVLLTVYNSILFSIEISFRNCFFAYWQWDRLKQPQIDKSKFHLQIWSGFVAVMAQWSVFAFVMSSLAAKGPPQATHYHLPSIPSNFWKTKYRAPNSPARLQRSVKRRFSISSTMPK